MPLSNEGWRFVCEDEKRGERKEREKNKKT